MFNETDTYEFVCGWMAGAQVEQDEAEEEPRVVSCPDCCCFIIISITIYLSVFLVSPAGQPGPD